MEPDNKLLPVPQYFPQAFPTQTGRAESDHECRSWATSQVAIITCFGQAASSCPHREGRHGVNNDITSYSCIQSMRQASVLTQVDCQHNSVIARLPVSKMVHAHMRREILQMHSDLRYKYTQGIKTLSHTVLYMHTQTYRICNVYSCWCWWTHQQFECVEYLPRSQTKFWKLL